MQIYLLRHGIAEDLTDGMEDADRALTPKGKRKLREVLERARAAEVEPSVILSSPLLRARQTAEIAAEILAYREPIVEIKALLPGSHPSRVWEEIRLRKESQQILLAGHEPLFSAMYAFLLNSPGLMVNVKKGSLGRIDMESAGVHPRGVLRWLLTPGA